MFLSDSLFEPYSPLKTVKLLKEELTSLLNCKYFSLPPPPPSREAKEALRSDSSKSKRQQSVSIVMHLYVVVPEMQVQNVA